MATIVAQIAHRPAHWNRRAQAHIPARWTVDAIEGHEGAATFVYSDGMPTREAAIADFIAQLKRFGLSGKLRLVEA